MTWVVIIMHMLILPEKNERTQMEHDYDRIFDDRDYGQRIQRGDEITFIIIHHRAY